MYGTWVLLLIILFSSLPVFAVFIWFRIAKYDFSTVKFLMLLLLGAAALFPALLLQDLLNFSMTASRSAMFYHFFIRIALTEELSRLVLLLLFFWIYGRIRPQERFEQPISMPQIKKAAAVGLVAGLGFSVLENAVYGVWDIRLLLLRAVTAAPLHGACGSRVGAAAAMLRSNPVQSIFRLLTAVAIHGIYNLMVTSPGLPSIIAILVALSALFTAIATIKGSWEPETENIPADQQ